MADNAIVREFGAVVVDVSDLVRMGAFWGAVLGQQPGPPRSGGDWLTVGPLEGPICSCWPPRPWGCRQAGASSSKTAVRA